MFNRCLVLVLALVACTDSESAPGPVDVSAADVVSDVPQDATLEGDTEAPTDTSAGVSGSRLELRFTTVVASDGTTFRNPLPQFFDRERGQVCQFMEMSDGTTRCIPSGGNFEYNLFADPACGTRLSTLVANGPCGSQQPMTLMEVVSDTSACRFYYRVFEPGEEHTAAVFSKSGANCIEATRNNVLKYFVQGREIQPAELVSGEFTTEP